jgi:glucose-1-phosphate thymidylyltransferase
MGDVIQAAIGEGLRVEAVHVSDEPFLDIGTPDDLIRAVKREAKSERRKQKLS